MGMIVTVTGQVGLDKKSFLSSVRDRAMDFGHEVSIHNIGDMMYAEAPDVARGKILDLPLSRLTNLRRSVFKDVLGACGEEYRGATSRHALINTHATFRWRHGLFYAFDYDQMKALDADLYVCLVDNVDRLHYRMKRDGHADHTLKDLMVWREEELLATELLSEIVRGHGCFYIFARGPVGTTADALARLFCFPRQKKSYLSFPMSHVLDSPRIQDEINEFRRRMKRLFVCFDPQDVEEKDAAHKALAAAREGLRTITVGPPGEQTTLETSQVIDIIPDIDGQIYSRDFKLIDQSDMIVSYIPALDDGRPAVSSGVERELQHAHEATRDVFAIWRPGAAPSPFVTATASKVFDSIDQAEEYFHANDYVVDQTASGAK